MADIIQLLPDSIANQIAAGEVIQRPASVVKELMENSIDAGSTSVKLIVKDAGKTLIQVIDNGSGMSETDARMAFERHATSKIRETNDLFEIRTMGFRGEAMASIAAIAQVEMRTRQAKNDLGTRITVEASEVKIHEPCQCIVGTTTSVKNLFFNVPVRRNFLKSTTVEMRYIIDEFQRIALAHSDVFFSLHHNGKEVLHLPSGNLRQRVVGILGKNYNQKLVPIDEETDVVNIIGYAGKPEFARKKRGDQYFFVNTRFIKSSYLHHAVMGAFEELLPSGTHPLYVIFIEIDPSKIDINVHPTKQEIKFDDERLVYNYLRVAVRHALGQYNVAPALDFDQETFMTRQAQMDTQQQKTDNSTNKSSKIGDFAGGNMMTTPREKSNLQNWQKLYEGIEAFDSDANSDSETESVTIESDLELDDKGGTFSKLTKQPYQVHQRYIISSIKSGFMLIDQQAAHERILYEKYLHTLNEGNSATQQQLFAKTMNLSVADSLIMKEILGQVNQLGFDVQEFGKETFVIHGAPAEIATGKEEEIIETLIEQYRENVDLKLDIRENVARSMARSASIQHGQNLTPLEMQSIIDELFACEIPYQSPHGKNCFITYDLDDLAKQF